MRMDLPSCGFRDCRKCFDGNCRSIEDYRKCEFAIDRSKLRAYEEAEDQPKANGLDSVIAELRQSTGRKTQFEQGFHSALDEIESYGKAIEHVTVN